MQKNNFLFNLLYFFILVIFSIYLFEFYLSYKQISKKNHKFKLVNKTIENNENNFWTVFPNTMLGDNLKTFPLSGYSNINTFDCDEENLGNYSNFNSDRYGFRNDDTLWDNEKKIFLIGDSYTLGQCVNQGHNISEHMQKKIGDDYSIINLGMAGNGQLIEYAGLREYAENETVDKIVMFFWFNDFSNLVNERNNKILNKYLENDNFSQNLKLKQKEINKIVTNKLLTELEIYKNISYFTYIKNFIFLKYTRSIIRNSLFKNNTGYSEINEDLLKFHLKVLKKTKSFSQKKNAELIIFYIPYYRDISFNNYVFNLLKINAEEANIELVNIKDYFIKSGTDKNIELLYPNGSLFNHYNSFGYKAISDIVIEYLKN
tara:strand:+ start:92 stop:1213 length:1122 start_codon:yes stop_codon:yes gene_type:complete